MPEPTLSTDDPLHALYVKLMSEREPDLLPENVQGLSEKYAAESAEEKEVRKERYAATLEDVFREIDEVIDMMKADQKAFRKNIMTQYEQKELNNDTEAMRALDIVFQAPQ